MVGRVELVYLTCKLVKLSPDIEVRPLVIQLLTDISKTHLYSTTPNEEPLYFHPKEVIRTTEGTLSTLFYDDILSLKRMTPDGEIISTLMPYSVGPVFVAIFTSEPLTDYIGIFAGNKIAIKLLAILSDILSKGKQTRLFPFLQVRIPIQQKQQDIRNLPEFGEVVEMIVEDIEDPYIGWAWVKGSALELSPEFRKFVEGPSAGRLTVLSLRFKERQYYLYEDGRLFTRHASLTSMSSELKWIFDLAKLLHGVGALP